jgi:hypothetical protein
MTRLQLCSIIVLLAAASGVFVSGQQMPAQITIHVRDYCDPSSFNASLGTGACIRPTDTGAITFPGFLSELNLDHSVGAWRFAPAALSTGKGAVLHLRNLGGETHTFTQVQNFGGGFVAPLNAAAGTPVPAPECAQIVDGNLIPQPPSINNLFIPAGTMAQGPRLKPGKVTKFQCCIHPWMRMTVRVNAPSQDGH